MRKILLALPLAVLASTNPYAEEVLFCNEIKATGIFFRPEGVVTAGVENLRFKASINGNGNSITVKGYSRRHDGTYPCETPFAISPERLFCSSSFTSITYNTKNNHGALAGMYIGDEVPKSGDSLVISLFRCDSF